MTTLSHPKRITVLVTGSNAPGFPSIVRSLKLSKKYQTKIIATDWKDNLKGKYHGQKAYVTPDNRTPEFADELLKICQKEKVDILIPIRTDDQVPICQHLEEFNDLGTIPLVATPNPELMEMAINKLKLLEYLKNVADLPTLKYHTASTSSEFIRALEDLGYPSRPVAIKPALGSGSRGFRILDENLDRRKMFFEEKPNGIYSTKEEILSILGDTFPSMLVMEYLEEPEYTLDILCYKGKTFAIIPRRRLRMIGGITADGLIEKLPEHVNQYVKKVIESFGFSYSIGMQIRRVQGTSDQYHLLEINPRLQGTTVISIAAGVNILEAIIDMAYREFDFNFTPSIKYGLKMERTYQELFYWKGNVQTLEELMSSYHATHDDT